MLAIRGWADPRQVEGYAHHWIALGQAARLLRLAKSEGCRDVVFIGALLRPPVTTIRLDWRTVLMLPQIVRAFQGGDDHLLSGIARLLEHHGLRVVGLKEVAPDLLMVEGTLGRHRPSARDSADSARALDLIAALGPFDVGQAAIVANGHVLAVEAAEGTDKMIERVAELRSAGRVSTPPGVGVLVKAPKPRQDRRFDLPTIGPQTVRNVVRAGLAGIVAVAGDAMMVDPGEIVAVADQGGVFVVGVPGAPAP